MENSKLDSEYLSWLAGFIDGEGCITVGVSIKRNLSGRLCLTAQAQISVHQHFIYRHVLDEIVIRFGFGSVYNRMKNTMSHYQTTNPKDTKKFIEIIRPFLKIKHKQADEIIPVLDLLINSNRKGKNLRGGERMYTIEECMLIIGTAASLNQKRIGPGRSGGRSFEELEVLVKEIYEQDAVAPRQKIVNCAECQKEFSRYFSDLIGKENNYCSKTCSNAAQVKLMSSDTDFIEISCKRCNIVFKRLRRQVKPTNYCSRKCRRDLKKEYQQEKARLSGTIINTSSRASLKSVEELKELQNTKDAGKIVGDHNES